MKLSIAAFLLSSATAFVVPNPTARFATARRVVSEPEVEAKTSDAPKEEKKVAAPNAEGPAQEAAVVPSFFLDTTDARDQIQPGRYNDIDYSITLPFWQRPPKLDGSHAGDFGFDPMGFTEEYDIYMLQEAELRHARLAMLAVAGWPLSEKIAPGFMLQDGRAPAVLNGFNPVSFLAVAGVFGAFGFFEWATSLRRTRDTAFGKMHREDMEPVWEFGVAGDYNWDPLNLYNSLGDDAYGRRAMREIEITQGRYAMLAITYFALYEAVSGSPIAENNMFFEPNALLPILGLGWTAFSFLYEVSDLREYPIKIQKSKLGKEFDEWRERRFPSIKTDDY